MRFLTLALEGYGRFREHTVFEFDAGLNCFVGANESGKSTLLAALMDALYTLPTSSAQAVRARTSWGHPRGWTLELELELRGERVRIRKFHPVDDPRRRGEFTLIYNERVWSGEAARAQWETLWRTPEAVYRATACVAQRALARLEKDALQSLQQQLRASALSADLNRILDTLQKERRRLRNQLEVAQSRLRDHEQRLQAAQQIEQQRRTLCERLRHLQQETEALRAQLVQDERLLENWRTLQHQRTTLERLRREADAYQRHLEQLEHIERRTRALEAELQREYAEWVRLPADHKEQVDSAWVRYQESVRRLNILEQEAREQQRVHQARIGRRKARLSYTVLGLALCAASVPLWGVAAWLGATALILGVLALAIALFWRTHTPAPDAGAPLREHTRHEAHAAWQQLDALLQQAGCTVETHPVNGTPSAHTHDSLQRLQRALQNYSERWHAFQERRAQLEQLRHQSDALHQLMPDPKALHDRQRELAVQIVGLEEQIQRNPLAHSEPSEHDLLRLDDCVQQARQQLDALDAERLRCEGALHALQTHDPLEALVVQHASLQQHVGQLQHRLRVLETAEALLQAANTRYLSDLSPRLKPRIEQHLPVLTLGRYTQADLGDDLSLQVYHPERAEMLPVREDSIVWSAGVLDQLFFACRLGLADALADDLRLPLLLDEPFVHADEERYYAALELLTRVAQQTQVLLFTCRPLPEGAWRHVVKL